MIGGFEPALSAAAAIAPRKQRRWEVAALKLERGFCVVDPQAAQDRGVQVMHVDWIAIDVVGEIICFPVPAIQIVKQRG